MADRTGKFVLLIYSLTASLQTAEAHLVPVPFHARLTCARLKSLPFYVVIKRYAGSAS